MEICNKPILSVLLTLQLVVLSWSTSTQGPQNTSNVATTTTTSTTTTTAATTTTTTIDSDIAGEVDIYNPKNPEDCNYDFTGAADDIFIIDSSQSVNEQNFYRSKEFVESLIRDSFLLRRDVNRIAVITYTSQAIEHFNTISGDSDSIAECELFLSGGLWDDIHYTREEQNGENLRDALTSALNILSGSDRPEVRKRLWVLTDFERTTVNPNRIINISNLTVYGVGVGQYNGDEEHEKFLEIVTKDPECNYRKLKDWEEALNEFEYVSTKSGGIFGNSVPVSNDLLCHIAHNCSGQCTCQEFDQRADKVNCTSGTEENPSEDDDNSIFIIIGAIGGVIAIVICAVMVCCCCIRCRRNNTAGGKTNKKMPTLTNSTSTSTTDTMESNSTDASTYTNTRYLAQPDLVQHSFHSNSSTRSDQTYMSPISEQSTLPVRGIHCVDLPHSSKSNNHGKIEEDLYANSEVADILKAHGVIPNNSTLSANKTKVNNPTYSNKYNKNPHQPNVMSHLRLHKDSNTAVRSKNNKNNEGDEISLSSQISQTPSAHSYFEVVDEDDPNSPEKRGPYSYAYAPHGRDAAGGGQKYPKSLAGSHSYEGFDFTPQKKTPSKVKTIQKQQQQQQPSNVDSELQKKLQRMRNRLSGAFSRKKQQDNNSSSQQQHCNKNGFVPNKKEDSSNSVQRFPKNIPNVSTSQMDRETNPVYKDPDWVQNGALPQKTTGNTADKRKSASLDDIKVKNLVNKFSSLPSDGVDKKTVHRVNKGYEPGPNGPYSLVNEQSQSSSERMSKPFREIM